MEMEPSHTRTAADIDGDDDNGAIGGAAAKGYTRPGRPAHEPVGQESQRQPPVEAPIASRARDWDHCAIRFMIGQ